MIYCIIDGKKAYPTTTNAIKITRENPYLKSSSSYTYDITFPLSILENRMVFGNVDRIDVRKKLLKYKECRLYADNRIVISGTGVVTGNTDKEIKLQIISGISELKYNVKTDNLYIDRIDAYENPTIDELASYGMTPFKVENRDGQNTMEGQACYINQDIIEQRKFLGDIQKWVFMPVLDTTNDAMANQFCYARYSKSGGPEKIILNRTCIQPNLIMVLKAILKYMGYQADLSAIDIEPWNKLIITNAHRTMKVRDALPHWTVTTFLSEISNLFNVSLIIDDITKEVVISSNKIALKEDVEQYDCLDDFSTEHDEDGIEYIGSSNVKYNIDQGGNYGLSVISQDNLKAFDLKKYDTHAQMVDAMSKITRQDRLQTIFLCDDGYYYFRYANDSDREESNDNITIAKFGQFTPLIRNVNSDTNVELKIVPVAMGLNEYAQLTLQHKTDNPDHWELCDRYRFTDNIPAVKNSHDETADYDSSFVSVQDAIEDNEDKEKDEKETDTNMYVGWVSTEMRRYPNDKVGVERDNLSAAKRINMWNDGGYFPMLYADWELGRCNDQDGRNSMSLYRINGYKTIGNLHVQEEDKSLLNQYDQVVIKFLADKIPNPRKLFLFKNKIFMCAKIEMSLRNNGIENEMTGYFYEK